MTSTLNRIEELKQSPDGRQEKGKRHSLWLMLMLVLLGTLCGYRGYRPLAAVIQQHWQRLCEWLELPPQTRLLSSSTFRRVLPASHNRTVHRRVLVSAAPPTLQQQWAGWQTLL